MAQGFNYGPGQNLTRNNRFAQMLMQQEQNAPPITAHSQGLASMLRQGLAGYLQGQDSRQLQAAQEAFATPLDQQPPGMAPGEQGPPQAPVDPYGSRRNLMMELSQGGNERATQMLPWVAQQSEAYGLGQQARDQAREDMLWEWENAPKEPVKPVSVSPGSSLVDTMTGKPIYTAPDNDKDRPTAKDEAGILRYLDTKEPVFDPSVVGKVPKDPKLAFDQEDKLRDEFTKGAGEFVKVRDAWNRIQASVKNPSAAGDLSLIFNYMKVLDPGSTVREGEFATAQNSAGIPDILRAKYNSVISGERLADTQRNDFASRAMMLYEAQENQYKALENRYRELAVMYDLDPEKVVYGMGVTHRDDGDDKGGGLTPDEQMELDALRKRFGR